MQNKLACTTDKHGCSYVCLATTHQMFVVGYVSKWISLRIIIHKGSSHGQPAMQVLWSLDSFLPANDGVGCSN